MVALMATFHLTISMRGQRATGKIQRNDYHHGNCGPSLTLNCCHMVFNVRFWATLRSLSGMAQGRAIIRVRFKYTPGAKIGPLFELDSNKRRGPK